MAKFTFRLTIFLFPLHAAILRLKGRIVCIFVMLPHIKFNNQLIFFLNPTFSSCSHYPPKHVSFLPLVWWLFLFTAIQCIQDSPVPHADKMNSAFVCAWRVWKNLSIMEIGEINAVGSFPRFGGILWSGCGKIKGLVNYLGSRNSQNDLIIQGEDLVNFGNAFFWNPDQ